MTDTAACTGRRVEHAPGVVEYVVVRKRSVVDEAVAYACGGVAASLCVYAAWPAASAAVLMVVAAACVLPALLAVRQEAFSIVPEVGVLVERASPLRRTVEFHPWSAVQSLFIHEAVTCCSVSPYLALATGDSEALCIPFRHTAPPAAFLQAVWRECDALWQ